MSVNFCFEFQTIVKKTTKTSILSHPDLDEHVMLYDHLTFVGVYVVRSMVTSR